jgi:hypothetical protein
MRFRQNVATSSAMRMQMRNRILVVATLLNLGLACSDANDGSHDAAGGNSNQGTGGRAAGGETHEGGDAGQGESSGGKSSGGKSSGGSAGVSGAPDDAGGDGSGDVAGAGGAGGTGSSVGGAGPGPGVQAARFFLPTGEPDNTAAPSVEVDAKGGIHTVYPAYAGGNAYYAYCGSNCSAQSDVKVVMFETQGTVANAMLALTADGRPRVLLSTFQKVYFASCDSNCSAQASWTLNEILDHGSDREISGEALALDPEGHPRFLMHTYRAYLGIGQKPPKTFYATCESDCGEAASWTYSEIAEEIWEGTSLRFDATGRAHVATVVNFNEGERAGTKLSAYLECDGACTSADDWNGIGFVAPYESDIEAVSVRPTVSLALTHTGAPRVAVLGKTDTGGKNIIYFECDSDCSNDHWQGTVVSNHDQIDAGLDLALDAQDHPRFVYTLNYNIGLAYCDQESCAGPDSSWDLTKVELGGEIPPDEIFLWENCTIGAWFLHSPSIALTSDGKPRVGYQARDISGGFSQPDPTKPGCTAGTDMTWSRLAVLSSYK